MNARTENKAGRSDFLKFFNLSLLFIYVSRIKNYI